MNVVKTVKLIKMRYCKQCKGKNVADIEMTFTLYPNGDGYLQYKTIFCPCRGQQNNLSL